MKSGNDYEEFFDVHAPKYMENCFTKNTAEEIEFLIEELKLPAGSRILDVGCGTGRHSVGLARRGYRMTGVDLSSGMLKEAQKAATAAEVEVEFIHADATEFRRNDSFDAAICLCEGAFSLFTVGDDPFEHDEAILKNIHASLKKGGKFIMTTLNAMEKIRKYSKEDMEEGKFDPLTLAETYELDGETDEGHYSVTVREKGYTVPELRYMFRATGFEIESVWGGTAGSWGRRSIDPDEIELMIVSRKK